MICISLLEVTTMALSRLILFFVVLMTISCRAKSETAKQQNTFQTKTFRGNGVVAIAGVTSRNGRVSSSVKVFRSADAKDKGSNTKTKDSNTMEPWTFSEKTDDGLTVGSVHISPGSVVSSVSSIGKSNDKPGQIDPMINFPVMNNFPIHSFPRSLPHPFTQRLNPNPLFPKNILRSPYSNTPDFGNSWFYPVYNPFFNVWQ